MKRYITAILLFLMAVAAFALPGVTQYTPDFSGEYVYYRDRTFKTASIVGFIYYNDSTYAARYYAPADSAAQTPERDITIYLTLDPAAEHIDFTGERIVGSSDNMEDTEVVNYLHDLLYEFTARRQKQTLSGIEPVKSVGDFFQFGGTVTITYSALIPIFNIYGITAADGTPVFELQTTGLLTDSGDPSFTAFKGVDGLPKDNARSFKKKSAKAQTASFEGQQVKLDAQWEKSMDNLWLLGESALLTMTTIPLPEALKDSPELFHAILLRKLSQSTTGSFSLWQKRQFSSKGGKDSVTNVFYQPDNGDVTRDFKVLTRLADGNYAYLTLTVFDGVYQKNKSYFNKIIKNYRVN